MDNPSLTIVICTYNRNDIIMDCINALIPQIDDRPHVEILVVDNYNNAQNHSNLKKLIPDRAYINLTFEKQAGLSHARNHGTKLCSSKWIAFLDDDAKPAHDFIQQAFWTIENYGFDCFGGHIRSWWKHKRPKWLAANYGEKPILSNTTILLTDDYNWGSNIFIKTQALIAVDGFPVHIGMSADRIGYSAENVVQKRLRVSGYNIGYNPKLVVDHLIIPSKLKLNWHIKAAYATGRDGRQIFPDNYSVKGRLRDIKNSVQVLFVALYKLSSVKGYHWKSAYLDVMKTWALTIGRLLN